MKTGVFVRIRGGIVADFIPMYNLDYKNDFASSLRFNNNMSPKEYFTKKGITANNLGKYNEDLSKWNPTNCLLRNEKDDKYPTTMYLSEFYDMLVNTCHHRSVPDCVFLINRKDFPYLDKNGNESYDAIYGDGEPMKGKFKVPGASFIPILSQSTSDRHADIPIPTGDDWDNISGRYFADPSRDRKFKCTNSYVIPPGVKLPAWEKRKPTFFWRGLGTGCGNTAEDNPRLAITKLAHEMSMAKKGPKLDAGITQLTRRDKINKVTKIVDFSSNVEKLVLLPHVDRFDQLSNKFMLNIEGNSAAYRFGSLFKFEFCVLNVDSQYKLWFEPFLVDRVHYIKVKRDLSDLQEIMEWCLANDGKCKQIAKNGKDFYNKYFSADFVYTYFNDIFNSISSMQRHVDKNDKPLVPYERVKVFKKQWASAYKLRIENIKVSTTNSLNKCVIVVPFRENIIQNRGQQLETFIKHYQDIHPTINILVVTQSDDGRKFNRGALLNAGYHFLSTKKLIDSTYNVIMHDVDLLVESAIVQKYYGYVTKKTSIVHMGKLIPDYYDYSDFLGGILAFSGTSYTAINGFPNNFFGWGGEDDSIKTRISTIGLTVYRPSETNVGKEIQLAPEKESKKIEDMINPHRDEDILVDAMIWKMNGLNSLQYKITDQRRGSGNVFHITTDLT